MAVFRYIDPDGNKREFTYVSGNPCDPNAPKDESSEASEENQEREVEADNSPPNYPTRPVRPRPTSAPKPVTFFQNQYAREEEEEQPEPEQILRPQNIQVRKRSRGCLESN